MFDRVNGRESVRSCPVCAAEETQFVRTLSKRYDLLSCTRCKCSFCYPFSVPSSDFYTDATDLASSSRHSGPTRWSLSHPTQHSPFFARKKSGTLLDVGCGNGAFAEFASNVGYQVIGIDGDATSIEIARSRNISGEFYCSTIDEFIRTQSSTQKFDMVTMFEVFEHLPNPLSVIQKVKALLRGEGLFIGSLPNTERLFMWHINMDYELPPFHLTYWTTRSWRSFLERQGFEILRCEPTIYYGYMTDVITNRYKMPVFFQRAMSSFFYPLEFKFEKHYKLGASFYFEAKLH